MVRRAEKTDLDAVFALMNRCVTPPWNREALTSSFACARNDVFVAADGGVIAGYVIVENVLDEATVASIAVREDYRRRGVGRKLLTHALATSEASVTYLEVNENNAPALALYASCGFEKIGERKKYYGDSGAVVMRREMAN